MGRQPCCEKVGLKKGPWSAEEDKKLISFILTNGQCCWRIVPKLAGLLRCGKSCRLRWTNYLRPDLKRGLLSEPEEKLVIDLHAKLGNRWSKIAAQLPGRTDNEIKNHWNTHIRKKLKKMGIDPLTHKPIITQPTNPKPQVKQVNQSQVEEKSTTTDADSIFCTDEVPMIAPDEILDLSTSTSAASCSSVDNAIGNRSAAAGDCLEDPQELQLPELDEILGLSTSSSDASSSFANTGGCIKQFVASRVLDDPSKLQISEPDWLDDDMKMCLWGVEEGFEGMEWICGGENSDDPLGESSNRSGLDLESWKFELM